MRVVALAIVLALLLPTFGNMVILIGFVINQNIIARELCENKAKPGSKCNGKCQLKKKLNEAANQERKWPANLILKEKAEFFTTEKRVDCALLFAHYRLQDFGFHIYRCSKGFYPSFFHPPPIRKAV